MKNVLALAVLFMTLSVLLFADIYYVAPGGSDSSSGSEADPWATIQHAADTLLPGDIVYVRAGAYNERVVPGNSGSPGTGITYAAYPGDTVTIDGQGITVPAYSGLFDLSGRSYITVSGFRVINSNEAGILGDNSSYLTIQQNYTYNTETSGISVWGCDHIVIDSNEVERACTGLYQESISVSGTDVFEVRNNFVHDVGPGNKEGICIKDGSSNGNVYGNVVRDTLLGIYVDAELYHTYSIQVYGNVTHHNTHDGIALATEQGGLLESISVFNNISYSNGWNGIDISACCIGTHPMSDIRVANNTFYSNGFGALNWGQGIYIENDQITGLTLVNNICSQNNSYQIAFGYDPIPPAYVVDYNLIDGPAEPYYGSHNVLGDPAFLNAAAGDFHLQTDSPARDAGTSIGAPADDFDGTFRPQGAGFDIGAYEIPSTGPCLFCDEFDDDVTDWSYLKGIWWENAGYLHSQAVRKGTALADPLFTGCDICSIRSRMQTGGGYGNRVWLLGWYLDKSTLVELMMKEESDAWVLRQRINKSVVAKAKASATIEPGVFYDASIRFDGLVFEVSVDGQTLLIVPKYSGSSPTGGVGLKVKATTATFDNIRVEAP